jgi:hypothetical protein
MHAAKKRHAKYLLATSAFALAAEAQAGETTAYSYDPLGRLVATSSTGTVNNGVATSVAYDPAGNRSSYAVTGAGGGSPPPVPPPAPPPANQPPVAVANSGSMPKCTSKTFAVLANDYDPDGNTPLSLVGVSYGGMLGSASVSGSNVYFEAYDSTGNAAVTYTVADSLGATANGTLTITITSALCQ